MEWSEARKILLRNSATRKAYEKVDLGYEIGKMIMEARLSKNMTQQQLAQLLGTKQPAIARLEKGNVLPSFSFLIKVAEALDTQLLPPRFEILEEARNISAQIKTSEEFEGMEPVMSGRARDQRVPTSWGIPNLREVVYGI